MTDWDSQWVAEVPPKPVVAGGDPAAMMRRIHQIARESPRWLKTNPRLVWAWALEREELGRKIEATLAAEKQAGVAAVLRRAEAEAREVAAAAYARRLRAEDAAAKTHAQIRKTARAVAIANERSTPIRSRGPDFNQSRLCLESFHELPIVRVATLPPETRLRMESGRLGVDRLIDWRLTHSGPSWR